MSVALEEWVPRTRLGMLVKEGRITSIDQVFEANLPISMRYRSLSWEKAHRVLGYTPQHDLKSMVELALAMRRGEDVGLIATGVPYGSADKSS